MSKPLRQIEKIRHSLSHLMSMAMVEKYPHTGLGVGPYIENGWYQDYDLPEPISEKDFQWLEKRMRELIAENIEFKQEIHSFEESRKLVKGDVYKIEIAEDLIAKGETTLSFYRSGKNFVNLCGGPHVARTSEINPGAFKLISIAGAYWRGDEKNKMLTRIYGVGFETQEELEQYLVRQEEAKKRDHRKLGKELKLFMFSDLVGPGLPIYMPKGAVIIHEIESFMRELHSELEYDHVCTPHITKEELFKISGHLEWFKDGMYPPMNFGDEGNYYAKPMNCPFHIQIYRNEIRSYRDLPIRYAEFGNVYRYEKSGEIGGLLRTRGFTQDDAHIFCREDQVVNEFLRVFDLTDKLLRALGLLNYRHRLSLPGEEKEKYSGNKEQWDKAVFLIREALLQRKIVFEEAIGEASFYGPKLDIILEDSLQRDWQISTIQVDFLQPERFQLAYTDSDGIEKRPYMIHRAPLGSRERIMAILIEHYAGAFPTWLAPTQVAILPVGENFISFAHELQEKFKAVGIRVEVDESNESVGKKIRNAEKMKIPYMLVVGEKEKNSGKLAVRKRSEEGTKELTVEEFLSNILDEIKMRRV